jgi:hypothetical protein
LNLKFRRLKIPELVCRESNFISLGGGRQENHKITNFHYFLFQLKYYSTMPRNRLTNGQKLAIITDTNQRLNQNESLKSIARSHNVQPVQIRKWKRQLNHLTAKKKSKKSISSGRPGRLKDFEEEIMGWAFQKRDAVIPLQYRNLIIKACELNDDFRNFRFIQQYHTIRRLCVRNCFVIRRVTHTSQAHPQETIDQALQFIAVMRPIVSAPNMEQKWIINMDQTPVFLSMHPTQTLDLQGNSTVNSRRTSDSGSRFTVSLAISANGDKLKPFAIFKGKPNGRIVNREFPNNPYRDRVALCCQDAAWQDANNMLQWIDVILVPYLQEKAQGVPALILLDAFSAHWTPTVEARLIQLGLQGYKVPPGCTCVTQPIDVGIGKPFKDRVRRKWWDWMMEQGSEAATFQSASRELGCKWVAESWDEVTDQTVRNAWRRTDFSYFV